ncbi:MAG: endonuclease/exonuclease/phosphatase family protein [Spirochaetales bacterium]
MKKHNHQSDRERELRALFASRTITPSTTRIGRKSRRRTPLVVMLVLLVAGALTAAFWRSALGSRPFRLISYNVQNLFDASADGGEYEEFRAENGYTRDRYWARLEELARVIGALARAPDAILLIELEHAGIAAELAEHFFATPYVLSSGKRGATTTSIALLTREAPTSLAVHAAAEYELIPGELPRRTWRSRDALHVTLAEAGFAIYGAHWKSQSGGERETERFRRVESRLAVSIVATHGTQPTLLVGDLNENLTEFEDHDGAYETALMPIGVPSPNDGGVRFVNAHGGNLEKEPGAQLETAFRSLWYTTDAPGTYFYRDRWERLDHAFLFPATSQAVGNLVVGALATLTDREGVPKRYDPRTGRGVSDHLPLLIELSRSRVR